MVEMGPSPKPTHDVYTVMVIVATAFVALGTIIIAVRADALFGSWLPLGGV
jgi:hypothetical protein